MTVRVIDERLAELIQHQRDLLSKCGGHLSEAGRSRYRDRITALERLRVLERAMELLIDGNDADRAIEEAERELGR